MQPVTLQSRKSDQELNWDLTTSWWNNFTGIDLLVSVIAFIFELKIPMKSTASHSKRFRVNGTLRFCISFKGEITQKRICYVWVQKSW